MGFKLLEHFFFVHLRLEHHIRFDWPIETFTLILVKILLQKSDQVLFTLNHARKVSSFELLASFDQLLEDRSVVISEEYLNYAELQVLVFEDAIYLLLNLCNIYC